MVSDVDSLAGDFTPDPRVREAAMPGRAIIQCQGLAKSFSSTFAVRDVSLTLQAGEILALVGPSGSGKTTLLRLLAGFEVPDAGEIVLNGDRVAGPGAWSPPESRRLGMVFQDYALFPHMTVSQNVAFGLKGMSRRAGARRARQMLELVSLDHLAQRYPYELSGGEQQRAALARSLAPRPLALLLDEPFSNVDPQLRLQLRGGVRNILRSSGVTAVYVTHDQEEALFMGDRVAVLNSGTLEQVGSPEEIFHHPRTRFVARFLGIADFIRGRTTEDGLVTEIGVLQPEVRVPTGTEVDVMIRPDDVGIQQSSTGRGRVVSRVFRGMHYLYGLSLPSGAVVHSLQHHTAYYEQGSPVDIYIEPDETLTCFVTGSLETGPVFTATPNRVRQGA